jgi:hypothetical protein
MKVFVVCQDADRMNQILGTISDELKKENDAVLMNPDTDAYFKKIGPFEMEHVTLFIEPEVDRIGENHLEEIMVRSLDVVSRQITVLLPFL